MTLLAFALVLTSAILHATWNYLAKRAGGGTLFVWMFSLAGWLLYFPLALAILIIQQPDLGGAALAAMLGTSLLHLVYYLLLQQGYRVGDLSIVYPLARGTGPAIASVGAVLLLGERPSAGVWVGTALLFIGVLILTGDPRALRKSGAAKGVLYGLLVGASIAAYTLWDKRAVSALLIPPLLLTWASNGFRALALAPQALRHWEQVKQQWATNRRPLFGIAVLDPLSYILFLLALQSSPVTLLSPLRQSSILIGAFLGIQVLSEDAGRRRLIAAGVMLAGLLALTLLA
ncbi:MAG: EamA family transporter [Anaerolineae bacterium]|nr:EamA family transporter [Anaerolineae bacterium]